MVFILGITPKRYLHNIFAKHIDSKSQRNDSIPYQLSASGYNCDNDNLVAESAFTSDSHLLNFPIPIIFSNYTLIDVTYSSVEEVYASLRGPPVNI